MSFVLFYYNDIKKHHKYHHECHPLYRNFYLQIYESSLIMKNNEIIIDKNSQSNNRNIYFVGQKCQMQLGNDFSLINEMKPFNISTFIYNNNIQKHADMIYKNLHKNDILILVNPYNSYFPIKNIKPNIVLEDLTKILIEDESLYYDFNRRQSNHQLNQKGMTLVTNYLKNILNEIVDKDSLSNNSNEKHLEKHHLITNLNAKYAMESYIKDVNIPLYINMFDKLQKHSLDLLEDYIKKQSLIKKSLKDILIQIFSKTLNESESYDYLQKILTNESLLENSLNSVLETLLKDVKISDNQHNLLKEDFLKEYRNGFIEVNCNPMTIGHVYLIKTALKFLEKNAPKGKLFILVVQKDSLSNNAINFETRFKIVQEVCKKLQKESFIEIVVVSNKNVLAGDVFTGYQKADKNTQESYEGGTNAMKLFAHFLAPMLNVGYRFFGTEEYDVTTNKYNEDAKKICPPLGIKVCILKRLSVKATNI